MTAKSSPTRTAGEDRLVVVIAPDSFKGTLTSVEVAEALAEGWRRAKPGDELRLRPLADGGEGTLAALAAAAGWESRRATVLDPWYRSIEAAWLSTRDGTAVIEMARASGLSLLTPEDRAPLNVMSAGTGELLVAALDAGFRRVILGIGGSATTDGGSGVLEALGARLVDDAGQPLVEAPTPVSPVLLSFVKRVDLSGLDPRLAELHLTVATDVSNPLLGPTGAAATYGPQKGASPENVAYLDAALADWANALEAATGRRERDTPGSGAAGGVGFALLCLRDRLASLAFRPGVEVVMELTGFESALDGADVVITGEGRIDAQTAFGKTAVGVARRARAHGVRCVAVGGSVVPEGVAALEAVGAEAVPVWPSPVSLDVALAAGRVPLVACGERLARVFSADAKLTKSSD